jgi:hypothetical protein
MVIRSAKPDVRWTLIKDVLVLPAEWEKNIHPPLAADGMNIPHPPLPNFIVAGFDGAGVALRSLTPNAVKEHLYTAEDVDTAPAEARRPSLRKREWIINLLRYCRTDRNLSLKGLPLAITSDGKLHTFGSQKADYSFSAIRLQGRYMQNDRPGSLNKNSPKRRRCNPSLRPD